MSVFPFFHIFKPNICVTEECPLRSTALFHCLRSHRAFVVLFCFLAGFVLRGTVFFEIEVGYGSQGYFRMQSGSGVSRLRVLEGRREWEIHCKSERFYSHMVDRWIMDINCTINSVCHRQTKFLKNCSHTSSRLRLAIGDYGN